MSNRLEELYEKMVDEAPFIFPESNREYVLELARIYAKECIKASLEKASQYNNTAIKSINTALNYFEERESSTIYKRDLISFLHAFHQFEAQGLSIVGMGYKRYDGKEITDLEGAYEGGYFTKKKQHQITSEENIIIL